ncbi:DUF4258 domain-containing protein [Candidatus Woesearchaeota archaeon]|nr:DUF4258 domain-containing protein [Candidatus Woesearchaeota archaeon]
MPEIILLLTKHAKEKMVIKGISKEQIKDAIKYGAKIKQTDGYLASYTYIKVAYKKLDECIYKIKTVFVS